MLLNFNSWLESTLLLTLCSLEFVYLIVCVCPSTHMEPSGQLGYVKVTNHTLSKLL